MAQAPSISTKRVWESVQLYSVKCGKCYKWRLIPTKEKYEEIREAIEQQPFSCETAREWRPEISCDDEADIKQDSNYRWAMDRPSIPQTPYGWQRIIRIRAEGGTKFADVYASCNISFVVVYVLINILLLVYAHADNFSNFSPQVLCYSIKQEITFFG